MAAPTGVGAPPPEPGPDAQLRSLDRLVGTWLMSAGSARGEMTYRWMDGGFFLVAEIAIDDGGRRVTAIDIIGRDRKAGADQPGNDIRCRYFDSQGNTFDYLYQLDGDTLTILGQENAYPARLRLTFSADGDTLSGDGLTMTRVR